MREPSYCERATGFPCWWIVSAALALVLWVLVALLSG